jgi:hypothetical protein
MIYYKLRRLNFGLWQHINVFIAATNLVLNRVHIVNFVPMIVLPNGFQKTIAVLTTINMRKSK